MNGGNTKGSALLGVLSQIASPATNYVHTQKHVTSLLRINANFRPRVAKQRGVCVGNSVVKVAGTRVAHGLSRVITFTNIRGCVSAPMGHCSSNVAIQLKFTVTTRLRPRVLIISRILTINSTRFRGGTVNGVRSISGKRKQAILFIDRGVTTMEDLYAGKVYLRGNATICRKAIRSTVSCCLGRGKAIQGDGVVSCIN